MPLINPLRTRLARALSGRKKKKEKAKVISASVKVKQRKREAKEKLAKREGIQRKRDSVTTQA